MLFIQWLASAFKGKWPTGGPVRERGMVIQSAREAEDERDKMS